MQKWLQRWQEGIVERIVETESIPEQMRIRWELQELYEKVDWVGLSKKGYDAERLYFLLNLLFRCYVPDLSVGVRRNKDMLEEYVTFVSWFINAYLEIGDIDNPAILGQLLSLADDDMRVLMKRFCTGRMYEYAYRFRYNLYKLMFKAECACQGFPYGFNVLYLNSKTAFYTDGWQLQSYAGDILSEKHAYEPNFITLNAVINGGD